MLIHEKINHQLTPQQSQVAQSAAIADIDNDQTDDDPRALPSTTAAAAAAKKSTSYEKNLFIHYIHEKRFRPVKRGLHQVYGNTFQNTPAMAVKLVVGNRNRRDARHELIRKKPKLSLLQSKAREIKSKYQKFLGNYFSSFFPRHL